MAGRASDLERANAEVGREGGGRSERRGCVALLRAIYLAGCAPSE